MEQRQASADTGRRADSKTSLEAIERNLALVVRRATLPRLHEHLASLGGVRLERAAYSVLARLAEEGPTRVTDLACALAVDLSTVSRQIAQLESADLVTREPDPADGRASRVSLTKQGERTLLGLRKAWHSVLTDLVSDWSAADRSELARLLGKLADSLAAYTDPSALDKAVSR